MKFHANGPDIPDKLLWERDAGQVVFICGAGVSRAKANMPDFPTLASQVLGELLVPEDGKARKILELALKPENAGLVPIDKVFGELERIYSIIDIEAAVSKALTAPPTADTKCHEIIRDLATTPYGAIRLVTTNFDDLFSRVTDQPEWICPILPSFENETTFSGLAYLHGKAGDQVNSTSSSFVLSTRSFGRAYMAEGWANDFIKKLLEHHTVVFVGYSADDPPMQYLLEALAQADAPKQNVYAFQQGEKSVADEKWKHRGVMPIAFDHYEDLWTTLGLWRDRAVSQDDWIEARLSEAMVGPANLSDWKRSQISHLASHRIGAKAIAERDEPIPPQWLFCFDSSFRYATPKKRYTPDTEIDRRDPFDVLGLIEDPTPKPISPDNPYSDRPTPSTVWDAFRITQQDIIETTEERSFAFLRGPSATNASELSPRLSHLAVWMVVSRIWWKFSGGVLRACGFGPDQAARSSLIGAMG
jgi:NAD-dependent SIR2 family protein deacetylase